MPVRWSGWGAEPFSRARAEGKPVLLTLAARWCHACHRMDRETWDDPAVAALVERATVAVRVDADARPDLYERYHLGGLPTTALLAADGDLIRGGTYLSAPAFAGFLDAALADLRAGRRLARHARPAGRRRPRADPHPSGPSGGGGGDRGRAAPGPGGAGEGERERPASDPRAAAEGSRDRSAPEAAAGKGGRDSDPAGPAALVEAIVSRLLRRADPEHGGLGLAPKHPEPDALTLLLRRGLEREDDRLLGLVRAALAAIGTHLADPIDGGFFRYAAAPDWTAPHTEKVALDQAALIRLFLEAGATLGDPALLGPARRALAFVRRELTDPSGGVKASLAAAPDYYARAERDPDERPPVDPRRFADAGAAMASAGLLAWAVTGEDAAIAREFMMAGAEGRIPHRLDAAEGPAGLLRDQALGLAAAVDRHRLTGEAKALAWARQVADWTLAHRWDDALGAFAAAGVPDPGEPVLPPMHPLLANGWMASALLDLAAHVAEGEARERYRARAARIVEALGGRAARSPAGPALGLAALRLDSPPHEADLEGDGEDPAARALARAVVAALGPTAVVRWRGGAGPARLTLCVGDLCLPPVEEPERLVRTLVDLGLAREGILGGKRGPSSPDAGG